jgi:glucose/mannose-6-phosphate isomerase
MMMNDLIDGFIPQLKEAISIGDNAALNPLGAEIHNVVITGLGGSGIGGSIVSELFADLAKVPILVNKDYFLPAFVGKNTLVIVSSFSGNTEETLNALEIAIDKKAQIACVTSGGKLKGIAKEKNLSLILIPPGDSPRAGLGYSLTQLMYILKGFGVIDVDFKSQLNKAIAFIESNQEIIKTEAKNIAQKLTGKTPVIYTTAGYEGVAIRLRQQINENAKMLCWHHVIPEMNHNELVGWSKNHPEIAPIMIRNSDEYSRTLYRVTLCKEIIENYTPNIIELHSKGESKIERSIYLINIGDWISWYLSEFNNVDATEVKVIDYLKGKLGKL